jgi:FkbM family methyltransferase
MHLHSFARKIANRIAGLMGVRVVNCDWGPVGFVQPFQRAKAKGFSPATIIDIGASTGCWTLECQSVFPNADYFLVDPLPENESALQNLAQNNRNIRYWLGALGATSGQLELNHHGDQSSFLPSDDFKGKPLSVEMRTLDTLLEDHKLQAPLLIKADVQGFELEVLKGATKALEQCEMLLLELFIQRTYEGSILAHDAISYLGERGFCIYDIASYVERPRDRALAYVDIVFVRQDSQLMSDIGWK